MRSIRKILQQAIWVISEIEALFAQPNDRLRFRRFFLRLSKVGYGKALWIGRSFHLQYPSNLLLGERCALGNNVTIENHAPIIIGNDFIGSTGLTLGSGSHDPVTMTPKVAPIRIGHRVWCGFNVTILSGVTIGDDVVIGAGSIVTDDIPSNSVAVGVPANIVKSLIRDPNKQIWTWDKRH